MKNDPAKIVLVGMIVCGVIGCVLGIGFGLHIVAIPFMAAALVLALGLGLG
jgi:putative lipase involved disintegration of autophagic bodies